MTQRLLFFVVGMFVTLAACGESSQSPAGLEGGQKVAPTKADPGESDRCVTSIPEDGEPVSAEEAEVLGIDSVGGDLNDVETMSDTRRVCHESYEVWVVTGSLPNGDDTETYITRDTGQVIYVFITGGSD